MNFLLPGFLAASALIVIPFLLHLIRSEPKKAIPFPNLRFLGKEALRDSRRNFITRWLLLLLRCLLILFAALAFARPFWPYAHSFEDKSVVVVVDLSYSMQAKGRLEAVESWLAPQLGALSAPDRLGVLVLGPDPHWLVPLSRNLEAGRAALRKLPIGFAPVNYRTGLDLAGAVLAATPTHLKQILLAGDEQKLSWQNGRFETPLPPGVDLLVAPTALPPGRQAAVVGLHGERVDSRHLMIEATVHGYAPAQDERTINFFSGDTLLGSQRFPVSAEETQTVHAVFPISNGDSAQLLRAQLDPDDLTADDTAYAVLSPANSRKVMLSAADPNSNFDFVAAALNSVQHTRLASFEVQSIPNVGHWPTDSVAILRGPEPFRGDSESALNAFIAQGGSAWILCDGSPEQTAWLARFGIKVTAEGMAGLGGIGLQDLALDHPLFGAFSGHSILPLLEPIFSEAWSLQGQDLQALARWPDHTAAIAEVSTGAGRILATGFGATRNESNFPTGAGFVPFVHQAVSWLAQNADKAANRATVASPLELAGSGTWTQVSGPAIQAPIAVDGTVSPSAPGIYLFQTQAGSTYYAVNLDTAESDLSPWPDSGDFSRLVSTQVSPISNSGSGASEIPRTGSVNEHNVWWWLFAGTVVLLMVELALANRTAA